MPKPAVFGQIFVFAYRNHGCFQSLKEMYMVISTFRRATLRRPGFMSCQAHILLPLSLAEPVKNANTQNMKLFMYKTAFSTHILFLLPPKSPFNYADESFPVSSYLTSGQATSFFLWSSCSTKGHLAFFPFKEMSVLRVLRVLVKALAAYSFRRKKNHF